MSQAASTSVSGNVGFGESRSWITPAVIVGGLVLIALAWIFTRKGKG